MAKKRLFQVAREYKITSEALLKMLRGLGFEVKSHMSSATPEILEAIEKQFKKEQESIKQEIATKKRKTKEREKKEYDEFKKMPEPPVEREKAARLKQLAGKFKDDKDKKKKRRRDKKKKKKPRIVDKKEVAENVKKTLARLDTGGRKTKYKRKPQKEAAAVEIDENVIQVNEYMSVAELANELELKPNELISKCMSLGMMVSINQRLDMEAIEMLALEYGKKIKETEELGAEELLEADLEEEDEGDYQGRPPVVTVMGHVDHGKTSLLDYIRETHVVEGEAGKITQHIGAYRVKLPGGDITFLDTPGHAAFTAMRARGAQITDIVVLVVAANDSVQQQTIEAINHARAAGVPIIVAINKMDMPDANADVVRQALAQQRLNPEEWGGKTVMVEISAKTGMGIDTLLENILLQADVLELEANYSTRAKGVVVEAKLEKGKGSVTTIIVQNGILHVGEPFVVGNHHGRVRAIMDDRGNNLDAVFPGWPAQITGSHGIPQAGDNIFVPQDESIAHERDMIHALWSSHNDEYRFENPVPLVWYNAV